jgi:hypothetical protein
VNSKLWTSYKLASHTFGYDTVNGTNHILNPVPQDKTSIILKIKKYSQQETKLVGQKSL